MIILKIVQHLAKDYIRFQDNDVTSIVLFTKQLLTLLVSMIIKINAKLLKKFRTFTYDDCSDYLADN